MFIDQQKHFLPPWDYSNHIGLAWAQAHHLEIYVCGFISVAQIGPSMHL